MFVNKGWSYCEHEKYVSYDIGGAYRDPETGSIQDRNVLNIPPPSPACCRVYRSGLQNWSCRGPRPVLEPVPGRLPTPIIVKPQRSQTLRPNPSLNAHIFTELYILSASYPTDAHKLTGPYHHISIEEIAVSYAGIRPVDWN